MLPSSPWDETHFDNPAYTALYARANATLDPSARRQITYQMQQADEPQASSRQTRNCGKPACKLASSSSASASRSGACNAVAPFIQIRGVSPLAGLAAGPHALPVPASLRNQSVLAVSDVFLAGEGHASFSSLPLDSCPVRADRRAGQGSRDAIGRSPTPKAPLTWPAGSG